MLKSVSSVKFDNNQDKNPRGFFHKYLRLNHPGKVIKAHLNINSIRNTLEIPSSIENKMT